RGLVGSARAVAGSAARPGRGHLVLAQPAAVDVAEQVVLEADGLVDRVEPESGGARGGGGRGGSGHHRLLRGGWDGRDGQRASSPKAASARVSSPRPKGA